MFLPLRRIAPQLSGGRRAALNFLTVRSGLLICALFLLAGLALAGDYGISRDERLQRQIAQASRNSILGNPEGLETLNYLDRLYGIAFELPLLLAEGALGLEDYHYVHRLRLTLTHLFFIVGGFFCWRLAYRLSNNRLIALLALLLYLLHPRLYAHSFFNSKDAPFFSMFVIALYLLERAFRRDTPGAFILLGLAVGLLTNLRIMGLMLLPAIVAMRGLDFWYAGNWPERKGILRTAGLFIVAAGLTFYATTPYAWANPGEYLAAGLGQAVNHPTILPQLFQGEGRLSNALPPHYLAVWFSITTPPLILLLGFVGMAAVLARSVRRPGLVFRNTRRRFLLLLTACFLLPPLAAALLNPNYYQDWRQLYFLYAPFCLLAALGGGWLLSRLARRRYGPAGMYGLAGLGLGLILLQMAQIHPWQHLYFNFLVDRTTPERLRGQYDLDYWNLAVRAGLEDLLARHPEETLTVRVGARHWEILPAAARRRLLLADGSRRADYALTGYIDPSQPDLAFNSRYGRRLYNNTLIAVRPLDDSRMTPAASAAYQELYRQAVANEPIIHADYAVYRNGRRLTFVQEDCPPAGRAGRFAVKFFPVDPAILPPPFQKYGTHARFHNYPARLGDICLAVIQLPDYAQAGDLIISRYAEGEGAGYVFPAWDELHSLSRPGLRETIAARRQQAEARPAGAEDFAVFLDQEAGRRRLLYAKGDCAPSEYETPVFLHLYPADAADLPVHDRAKGFANRDFLLPDYGGRIDGECIAAVPLPDYPIAALRTGQVDDWAARLYPAAGRQAAADYRDLAGRKPAAQAAADYRALAGREPAARAAFDLYLEDNLLIYYRESCAAADTAAAFFLHIIPEDRADLPRPQRAAGFANWDFAFDHWGEHFDGRCIAIVPLPGYPIKTLRTGQRLPGPGQLWAAELAVGR